MPLFIGFVTAGIPLGVTFSFLIAAPMVNEVALVLLFGLFGWKVTAVYIVSGLAIATIAGWTIGRLHMERWVEPFVFETRLGGQLVGGTERPQAAAVQDGHVIGQAAGLGVAGVAVAGGQARRTAGEHHEPAALADRG